MSHSTAEPTKGPVRPAKTHISLGIHPIGSVFAVRSMGSLGPMVSSCGQRRLCSDWADLSLGWAHRLFSWFCYAVDQISCIHKSCLVLNANLRQPDRDKGFWWAVHGRLVSPVFFHHAPTITLSFDQYLPTFFFWWNHYQLHTPVPLCCCWSVWVGHKSSNYGVAKNHCRILKKS